MNKIKLKLKLKLRLSTFLFIRKRDVFYEDPDGVYDVYELFERIFPFVYKWTGVWTPHTRGRPFIKDRLDRIIRTYEEKGHV